MECNFLSFFTFFLIVSLKPNIIRKVIEIVTKNSLNFLSSILLLLKFLLLNLIILYSLFFGFYLNQVTNRLHFYFPFVFFSLSFLFFIFLIYIRSNIDLKVIIKYKLVFFKPKFKIWAYIFDYLIIIICR